MNENMQQKMLSAWVTWHAPVPRGCAPFFDDVPNVNPSFEKGFTACHDMLMPLLIEALPHAMANEYWPDGQTSALVKRISEVIPIITKGETA